MRLLTPLYTGGLVLSWLGTPLGAQNADALYAGRHCNQELARLPAATLSDVVDSGRLTKALREAADSTLPITKVVFTYEAYGQLGMIKTAGTRSPAAEADLEREARAAAKPVTGLPDPYHFMATIVRLNRRDVIDISPSPLTCPPRESSTPEAERLLRTSHRFSSSPPRDAVVQLWLGSNGDVTDAWIVRSAGRPELDSLALAVVRVLRYSPPVFGSMPVATLLQVPVHF
jgi:TonB family protein